VRFGTVRQRFTKPTWHRSSSEPVLGTRFTLQVLCTQQRVAEAVAVQLQTEIERLEDIFSVYRPHSTLSQWKNATAPGTLSALDYPELCEVLALAELWRVQTGGCFTPLADEFTKRWRKAEAHQIVPAEDELNALCRSVQEPRYLMTTSTSMSTTNTEHGISDVTKIGDCSALSLHAIAKGWIVDRAAELAMRNERVSAVVVNIGGDLRLCGAEALASSTLAIENPLRAYDNEPPIARITMTSGGLATSGGSRRGFTINGQWYSHVIDPRTGHPVDRVASASVFAPTAAAADALATMLSVVAPDEGLSFLKSLADDGTFPSELMGCLIIDKTGQQFSNHAWDQIT
jgi:FAD:protein FMN transferase